MITWFGVVVVPTNLTTNSSIMDQSSLMLNSQIVSHYLNTIELAQLANFNTAMLKLMNDFTCI
jgi:hypothetical protein